MALPAFCDGGRCRVLLSMVLERVQCISHRIYVRYIICLHLVDYIITVNVAKYTIHYMDRMGIIVGGFNPSEKYACHIGS